MHVEVRVRHCYWVPIPHTVLGKFSGGGIFVEFFVFREGGEIFLAQSQRCWQCIHSCNDAHNVVLQIAGGPLVADVDVWVFFNTIAAISSAHLSDPGGSMCVRVTVRFAL